MQIDHVNTFFLKEYKNQKDKSERTSDVNLSKTTEKKDNVTLDISSQGKSMADQIQTMRVTMAYLKEMNSVRQEKIDDIQQKIKAGYYDSSSDVHQIVAERLMSLLSE